MVRILAAAVGGATLCMGVWRLYRQRQQHQKATNNALASTVDHQEPTATASTAAALSPETLERHRFWHTIWNVSALVVINGSNLIWLYKLSCGRSSHFWDFMCDLSMVGYQVLESAVDVTWPHLTSSLPAALTHHAVTAFFMLFMRLVAREVVRQPELVDFSRHELVLAGELQNLPRMLTRILTRGGTAHTLTSHVSDVLLVLRLLWWPLIPLRWVVKSGGLTPVEMAVCVLPFIGHFVVYSQQLRLFRRDLVRLRDMSARMLGLSKAAKE